MTRPRRLFVPDPPREGERVHLAPEQVRHARVLRLRPGDALELFDGGGGAYDAQVERAGRQDLVLRVRRCRADAGVESPVAITVLQGLARGTRMEQVVRHGTELGVVRVVPVRCRRCTRRDGNVGRWRTVAREGARQCGRAKVPEIGEVVDLEGALARLPEGARIWLAGPGAQPLPAVLPTPCGAVVLLVGPEGGLDPDEVGVAQRAGFVAASLGPRVLRTETAALAAVGLIQGLHGDARAFTGESPG